MAGEPLVVAKVSQRQMCVLIGMLALEYVS